MQEIIYQWGRKATLRENMGEIRGIATRNRREPFDFNLNIPFIRCQGRNPELTVEGLWVRRRDFPHKFRDKLASTRSLETRVANGVGANNQSVVRDEERLDRCKSIKMRAEGLPS